MNIAPSYTKTTIRKGQEGLYYPANRLAEYGDYLQAGSSVARLTARESRTGV